MSYERQQIELARRAIRGEQGLTAAGYQKPSLAPALPTFNSIGQPRQTFTTINVTGPGTFTLVSGTPAAAVIVYVLFWFSETEQTLEFWDGAQSLTGPLTAWPAQQGALYPFTDEPYFECSQGNPFNVSLSAAGQLSGWLRFRME